MNEIGGAPIYSARGAQPRPVPGGGARSSWRGSMILLVVMFGWMIITFALAAIAAPNDPNIEVPVPVGQGVVVTPADGWYSASDVWDVGAGAVSLQKAGVYVAFFVAPYAGTNDDLLSEWLDSLKADFASFRVLPETPTTIAGDVPGLSALVNGASDDWGPENEVVVAVSAGIGLVMFATAPAGQLAGTQDDLDTMLQTLVVPR